MKFKTYIVNTTVSIITFLIVILLSELILDFVYDDNFSQYKHSEIKYIKTLKQNSQLIESAYGDLAYMIGDFDAEKKIEYKSFTNENGSFIPKCNSEKNNTIVLGDSYSESYIANGEYSSWVDFLSCEKDVNLYCASLSGTGPYEQFLLLSYLLKKKKIKMESNPELLWCIFSGNDYYSFCGTSYNIDSLTIKKTFINSLISKSEYSHIYSLVSNAIKNVYDKESNSQYHRVKSCFLNGSQILFYKNYIANDSLEYNEIIKSNKYLQLVNTITHMQKLVKENNINLKLLFFPSKNEVYDYSDCSIKNNYTSPFERVVMKICDDQKIPFFSLHNEFIQKAKNKDFLWLNDDTHWNTLGNKVCYEYIKDSILTL